MREVRLIISIVLGDVNLDGRVDGLAVDPLVDVLLNGPFQAEADMNEDQFVNGLDVQPFLAAALGGGTQQLLRHPCIWYTESDGGLPECRGICPHGASGGREKLSTFLRGTHR